MLQPETLPRSTQKRVSLNTLGCRLNYAETRTIAAQFATAGFEIVAYGEPADVTVLNTCSVTENAEKECRKIVRSIERKSPETFIAVTGCYAQLRPEEIASIAGVDAVLGANEKFDMIPLLGSFEKRSSPVVHSNPIAEATDFYLATNGHANGNEATNRTRAYLKIQDGCDYTCAFCTIPQARGASRSGTVTEIVNEAVRLSEEGYLEIILSGVNVGDFGRKSGSSFFEVLSALEEEPRVTARIRISSIEPNLLRDEIIQLVAHSRKICHHFHIPLQSGSRKILRLMQRRYDPDLYRDRVSMIRSLMPHAGIGADVITGFPGESEIEFEESYEFIRSLDLSYLHVFTYSERPNTKAPKFAGKVDVRERRDRTEKLRMLSEKLRHSFFDVQIGRDVNVILEKPEPGSEWREGYSDNYIKVQVAGRAISGAGLVRVRLDGIAGDIIRGSVREVLLERSAVQTLLPILA